MSKLNTRTFPSRARWYAALFAGAAAIAAVSSMQQAQAASGVCTSGTTCERDMLEPWAEQRSGRYDWALQKSDGPDSAARSTDLSDQDYTAFSGVGMIVCTVDGKMRSSTAFLVGAFDIGVTVAHTFEKDSTGAEPKDCVYNSVDSLGQIRERIPVSYVKSQWDLEAGAFGQPAKDLAVVRLSQPSRYAQRTMPLGRFSGEAAPVVMIGYKSDVGAATVKRKASGTVYDRDASGLVITDSAGFTHDLYSRGIAAGAPVIDERNGVIIGIHSGLPERNAMITMNDWLESTLRAEMQTRAHVEPQTQETARAN